MFLTITFYYIPLHSTMNRTLKLKDNLQFSNSLYLQAKIPAPLSRTEQ